MPRRSPELSGERLASELNEKLRVLFKDRTEYVEAIEAVIEWFEPVLQACREDEEREQKES